VSSISIVAGLGKLSATVGNSDQRFRAAIKPLSVPATFFGERDGPEPGLPSEVRPDAGIVTEISQFCHNLVSLRLFATAQGLLNGSPANYLHAAGELTPRNLAGREVDITETGERHEIDTKNLPEVAAAFAGSCVSCINL